MKTVLLLLLILLALCTVACDPPAAQPPAVPQQEVVQEYGEDQTRTDEAMEELSRRHDKIQDSLKQWRDTPAPIGPVFEGEGDALAKEILEDCDTLEREAGVLSKQAFVREHKGAPVDLEYMIQFARVTREEVEQGKQPQ